MKTARWIDVYNDERKGQEEEEEKNAEKRKVKWRKRKWEWEFRESMEAAMEDGERMYNGYV